MEKAVSTDDVRSIISRNPSVTEELSEQASKLSIVGDREEQKKALSEMSENLSPDAKEFLRLTALREEQHRVFMKKLLTKLDLPWKGPCHDYSKDSLFFFVAACYFDGGVKTEVMKLMCDAELRRHYVMESHHPEHELYTDEECDASDLREMALDRLARNVQYGDGRVDLNVMKNYLPVFHRGETELKKQVYIHHLKAFSNEVEEYWGEMFYFSPD